MLEVSPEQAPVCQLSTRQMFSLRALGSPPAVGKAVCTGIWKDTRRSLAEISQSLSSSAE